MKYLISLLLEEKTLTISDKEWNSGLSAAETPAKIELPETNYDVIFVEMTQAFLGNRDGCSTIEDTKEYVRKILTEAIYGVKHNEGGEAKPWQRCPARKTSDIKKLGWRTALNKRLRVFHYDLDKGFIGRSANVSSELSDPQNPFEFHLTPEQVGEVDKTAKQIVDDFPELDAEADSIGIQMLAYIKLKNDEIIKTNKAPDKKLVDMFTALSDNLGISGNKRKAVKERLSDGTLEQLFTIYSETKKVYPTLEEEYYKEEVALLWQMYNNEEITRPTFDALISRLGFKFATDDEIVEFIKDVTTGQYEALEERAIEIDENATLLP